MSSIDRRVDLRGTQRAELLFKEATIFDPTAEIDQVGDLLVRSGLVAEIAAPGTLGATSGVETIDAKGLHIFPGFVDPHVHLRTPGREDEEDIDSGTRAAAAGGFTLILAMPNTEPVVDTPSVLMALRERARVEARVPVGFLAAATRGQIGSELTDMVELIEAGACGFSDDGVPVASALLLRRALQYQKLCGGLLALHEEDPSLSGSGVMHEGQVSAALGLAGIPAVSESTAIARDAAIARYEDGRCHMLHLSSALSVEAVATAKELGAAVTAEVSPHHLTLTDEAVRTLDTNFKMNPPLRADSDRQALIEGLRSGVIDCIATDHAPHSQEEKEEPFEVAPMGVTGLETAFSVLYTDLVESGVIRLSLLVEKMTAAAPIFDFERPSLKPGSSANLSLINLGESWQVGQLGHESRSDNSAFAGRNLKGRVLLTVAAGQEAYRHRNFAIHLAEESQEAKVSA